MSGPSVVALGDSITLGVGDGVREDWGHVGWAAHAAAALGARAFANLAANGTRARDLAAQVADAVALDPDVALLTVGGNDALRGDFDPGEVERCTRAALVELTRGDRAVVLATIDRIGLFDLLPERVASAMARRAEAVNAALRRASAGMPVTIVDGSVIFAADGAHAWHIDRIHPSQRGHRALARAAVEALGPAWPQVAPLSPPAREPSLAARAWWLTRHGVPWAARRSRDLLPQVLHTVRAEMRATTASAADTTTAGRP
ncbi:GDSL-type esterase/lipase family protein [Demequina sp. NBRC 110057]|uniref:SGNH/GDSL hydrolase family protein n=1 Tax=Demequina sp. NBRC 110057 TaxID=1570346 RepID=UPI000A024E14|nr:GDSL-type esterase/lipase family protein [Demequina sp. NBRC 110057]